ncbi:hypothetical protein [Pseudonocardia asaccharolytica]|uniref:hypothetical protein n=1 Tax=Pseudonocardia asaccharolytica TaxID=54010 RepID=UPI00048B6FFA|nr:hypothetical protein [Pseudonocardia asaccharolytica]
MRGAAGLAAASPSVPDAVRVAWQHLHTNRAVLAVVFRAWAAAEGVADIPDLGGVLRRRHTTPDQVAAGLRRAATLLEDTPDE